MMARNDSQCAQILAYIQAMGSITDDEARKVIGSHRLAARIADLRKAGWPIVTEWGRYIEDGHTVRYGIYKMQEPAEADDILHMIGRQKWHKEAGAVLDSVVKSVFNRTEE